MSHVAMKTTIHVKLSTQWLKVMYVSTQWHVTLEQKNDYGYHSSLVEKNSRCISRQVALKRQRGRNSVY
jgi:hypothetical protein